MSGEAEWVRNPRLSSIIDNPGQMILDKSKVRILGWYANSFVLPPNVNQLVGTCLECCVEKDLEVPGGLVGRVLRLINNVSLGFRRSGNGCSEFLASQESFLFKAFFFSHLRNKGTRLNYI